ncbi:hypothetical protein [Bradyrhizobium japonicum]|uniref:hypothetical protein n=1 Tax=Bradyrhizobium japonicum TaxID=375 RepID=UPI001BA693D1|nr:hypothetical protein [Bradyrhizobium japonicum]MBR0916456.1 hypothetical protein [Bradyrhizobium japonicum]
MDDHTDLRPAARWTLYLINLLTMQRSAVERVMDRRGLAEPMRPTWNASFLASVSEPVAEAGRGELLPELGREKRRLLDVG